MERRGSFSPRLCRLGLHQRGSFGSPPVRCSSLPGGFDGAQRPVAQGRRKRGHRYPRLTSRDCHPVGEVGRLVHFLRNRPVRVHGLTLERDGFILERTIRTGSHLYRHPDSRMTLIHYHAGSDTLTRKTLASVLRATRWNEEDLQRLGFL